MRIIFLYFIIFFVHGYELKSDLKVIKMGHVFECEASQDIIDNIKNGLFINNLIYVYRNNEKIYCVGLQPINETKITSELEKKEIIVEINFKIEHAEVNQTQELQVINQDYSGNRSIYLLLLLLTAIGVGIGLFKKYLKNKNQPSKNEELERKAIILKIKQAKSREDFEYILNQVKRNNLGLRNKFNRVEETMKNIQYKKEWTIEEFKEVEKKFKEISLDV